MPRLVLIILAVGIAALVWHWISFPVSYARLSMWGEHTQGKIERIDNRQVLVRDNWRRTSGTHLKSVDCLEISYQRQGQKYNINSCDHTLKGLQEGDGVPILVSTSDPEDAIVDDEDLALSQATAISFAFVVAGLIGWRMQIRPRE